MGGASSVDLPSYFTAHLVPNCGHRETFDSRADIPRWLSSKRKHDFSFVSTEGFLQRTRNQGSGELNDGSLNSRYFSLPAWAGMQPLGI